jgi:hypothetical protein
LCIQVALASAAAAAVAVIVAGISRLMLDSFPDDPVLFVTEQGPAHAAAVVLSSDQEAQMVAMQKTLDFDVIPGTLQMSSQALCRCFRCLFTPAGNLIIKLRHGTCRCTSCKSIISYGKDRG